MPWLEKQKRSNQTLSEPKWKQKHIFHHHFENTDHTCVICDPKILKASWKDGVVKIYTDLYDWRLEHGLEGTMALVRATTIVPDSLTASLPLSDVVSNCLVGEMEYMDVSCDHLASFGHGC